MDKPLSALRPSTAAQVSWIGPAAEPPVVAGLHPSFGAAVACGLGAAFAAARGLPDPGAITAFLLLAAGAKPYRSRDIAPAALCGITAIMLCQAAQLPDSGAAAAAALAGVLSFDAGVPGRSAADAILGALYGSILGVIGAVFVLSQLDSITAVALLVSGGAALFAGLAAAGTTRRSVVLPCGVAFLIMLLGDYTPPEAAAGFINRGTALFLGAAVSGLLLPPIHQLEPRAALMRSLAETLEQLTALVPSPEKFASLTGAKRFQAALSKTGRRLDAARGDLPAVRLSQTVRLLEHIHSAGFSLQDLSAHAADIYQRSESFKHAADSLNAAVTAALVAAARAARGRATEYPNLTVFYEQFIASASREITSLKDEDSRKKFSDCLSLYGDALQSVRAIVELTNR